MKYSFFSAHGIDGELLYTTDNATNCCYALTRIPIITYVRIGSVFYIVHWCRHDEVCSTTRAYQFGNEFMITSDDETLGSFYVMPLDGDYCYQLKPFPDQKFVAELCKQEFQGWNFDLDTRPKNMV